MDPTSVITETTGQDRRELAVRCHPACLVCGRGTDSGLKLDFESQPDGSVVTRFECAPQFQGYPNRVHGGVIAMLADAAMTHCLFARGVSAVTARLELQFRHPVVIGVPSLIRAEVLRASDLGFRLEARLEQNDRLCVVAQGLFCPNPDSPP